MIRHDQIQHRAEAPPLRPSDTLALTASGTVCRATEHAGDVVSVRRAFVATHDLRTKRRVERGLAVGAAARGLGKLLVVAPDQAAARAFLNTLRGWMPAEQAHRDIRLATSSERGAHEALVAFRLLPEPSILVTVGWPTRGWTPPRWTWWRP